MRGTVELPGGPTQEEVIAVVLGKLRLRPGDRVVEIGCGTGAVTLALAKAGARVMAIDRRPEAIAATRERLASAGFSIDCVAGEAAACLSDMGPFDAAFVGGSRDLAEVLGLLADRVSAAIVVNAVLLSTVHAAIETMTGLGIFEEAVQVQIARSYPLAGSIMWRPIDPVCVIIGRGRRRCS